MIEHVQRHWGKYIFGLFCVFFSTVFSLNFNTIAYLITKDPNLIRGSSANQGQITMRFSPASGQFRVGDTVTVSAMLDVPQPAINADAGEILFPANLLSIQSVSTDGSINTLWVPAAPQYSTTTNSIVFAGGMPPPGFAARDGKLLTVSFLVKAAGVAQIRLNNVKVLAADGAGTELGVTTQPMTLTLQNPPSASGVTYQLGDLNHDGKVDMADASILMANWGTPKLPEADLNGDGVVNAADLSILLSRITPSP